MLHSIVRWSLRSRLVVLAIGAAVIFVGFTQLRDTPVSVFPEFEAPHVEIQTEALGLSAAEVERLVAVPMEELLTGTALVKSLRSESVPGLASIELVFEPGTDPNLARQLVQERLSSVFTLPNVTKPPVMIQPLSATNRVMIIGLRSDERSLIEMSVLARWNITPKLLGVPGVANVAVWGQRDRQLQVQTDPELLRAHGVTLDQFVSTTGDALWVSTLSFLNASVPGTGGWIDSPSQRLGIRHVLPISSPEDLANVSVDGTTLRLGDLATIVEGHPPLIGDAFTNDGPGLLLVIEKFPEANTLEVTRNLETAFEELQVGLTGIELDTNVYRTANYIDSAIDNIALAALIGVVLVGVAVALLFFDLRVALISLVAIVLSLLTAVLVLRRFEATVNVIVLVGLAIAVVTMIDDSIVDVGSFRRRQRQARGDRSAAAVVLDASVDVRGAILVAALVGVFAVAPVFFIEGEGGSFYRPLAISYAVALAASMLVALTVTPVLSVLLLSRAPRERRKPAVTAWLHGAYNRAVAPVVDRPRTAILAAGLVVLAGVAVPASVGNSLLNGSLTLPSFEERDLRVELQSTPGVSPSEMTRIMARASEEVRAIPGVDRVAGQIGRAETGTGPQRGRRWRGRRRIGTLLVSRDPISRHRTWLR